MSQWLQDNSEFLIGIITFLLTVLMGIASLIVKYVKDQLDETGKLKDAVLRNTQRLNENHQIINDSISQVQARQGSQGERLTDIQRAVDRGALEQERQSQKTDQVIQDTNWTRNKLEALLGFYGKLVKTVAQNDKQTTENTTELVRLKNIIIVKNKKQGGDDEL